MTTVVLIRHGRTSANTAGVLAGWSEGVLLDNRGTEQAHDVARRLSTVKLSGIVSSPLERTVLTAQKILERQTGTVSMDIDEDLGECHYGDWTGKEIRVLAKDPLWKSVQNHPSSVTFPGGESLSAMQQRATAAIRRWNGHFGPKAVYAVVSHGDVIKAILAEALGTHLDLFQRICVDPGSISVVSYAKDRPFVVRSNDSGTELDFLSKARSRRRPSDAVVGGGAGNG